MPDNVFKSPNTQRSNQIFNSILWTIGVLVFLTPLTIVLFLAINGLQEISWSFISTAPAGLPIGSRGGVWPAIQGSLALVSIGISIALPIAVSSAIYISEYSKSETFNNFVRLLAENFASIPTIIFGMFGYAFLVVIVGLNVSLLAGGITLALLMAPQIFIGSQEAILAVEDNYRHSALSLGVSKFYFIRKILFRKALPGIISISTLNTAHALGSAAPVLYTATVILAPSGLSFDAPVMSLPTHLYYLVGEGTSLKQAFGTSFVLVSILLVINIGFSILNKSNKHG